MHGLHISEWSFKDATSGWKMIQYFSFRHRLQRFAAGLYAGLYAYQHWSTYLLLYLLYIFVVHIYLKETIRFKTLRGGE